MGVALEPADTGADLIAAGGQKWLLGPEGQGGFISSKLLDRLTSVQLAQHPGLYEL